MENLCKKCEEHPIHSVELCADCWGEVELCVECDWNEQTVSSCYCKDCENNGEVEQCLK